MVSLVLYFYFFIVGTRIRLVSSSDVPTISSGSIQMWLNNEWLTLCYAPNTTDIGEVACKQLGFTGLHDLTTDYTSL